ncbi:MAG: hypothetical protein VW405_11755, partial [Rhodospirillaceae bacterium]
VHNDAMLDRQGRRNVFDVKDGKAAPRPIELGEATGSRFAVTDGLKPGDLAVVRGNERLRPGAAVTFDPPPGAAGNHRNGGEKTGSEGAAK